MITDGLQQIDASRFGFSKRLSLYQDSQNRIVFVVNRKSRFIMKDTIQFLERSEIIEKSTGEKPMLYISAPLCSKSKTALEEEGIQISFFE